MSSATLYFLNEKAHGNLRAAHDTWRKSCRARSNAVEETKRSGELVETLVRETRIWVLSKLADQGRISPHLVLPPPHSTFGAEINLLEQLRHHDLLAPLAGATLPPELDVAAFQRVVELIRVYTRSADSTLEELTTAIGSLAGGARETWLETMSAFLQYRNIDSHTTDQPGTDGSGAYVADKLERAAPLVAAEMRRRIDWLIHEAGTHLGQYELRSTDDVRQDRDHTVQTLLRASSSVNSATHVYVRYDDDRNALELFPRRDRTSQLQNTAALADESDSSLFRSARAGRLLPLIGTAYGLPDQPSSPGAAEVIARCRAVVADPRHAALENYLETLISNRLGLEIEGLGADTAPGDDSHLSTLVAELATLTCEATQAFGRALAARGAPLTDRGEPLDPADADALSQRIAAVIRFVRTLRSPGGLSSADRSDLGVDGIIAGLETLASGVLRDRRLAVNSLAWLDDLVWHALRWDAPLFPDAQALDVQLSLGVPREPDRKFVAARVPASSGATLFLEEPKLNEYLIRWSRRMNERMTKARSRSRGHQDSFEVIARAMMLCLASRQTGDDAAGTEGAAAIFEPVAGGDWLQNVFIVDTTFDQRMCTAIETVRAPGAVVFPIDIVDSKERRHPMWAVRRFPRPAKADLEYSVLWDGCGRTISWQDIPRLVVIKPYGAPLEVVDPLVRAIDRARREGLIGFPVDIDAGQQARFRVQPRFLCDDVSIVKDMVRKQDSMPPGFRQAIHDPHAPFELYFLGHTMDEYGRRARMVVDVQPADGDEPGGSGQPRYLSQPPPSGSGYHYLKRAGFLDDKPLFEAIRDLASSLALGERDGVRS